MRRRCRPSCIDTVVKEYLASIEKKRYSPRTLDVYRRSLQEFGDYLTDNHIARLQNITTKRLEGYQLGLVDRGFKFSSVLTYMRPVRGLFAYLEETQQVFVNPVHNLAPCRGERTLIPAPTEEEVQLMLESVNTGTPVGVRDRAILETAYAAGLRRRELLTLDIGSVDLAARTLRVMGKGSRERVLPLTSAAIEWLERYINEARPKLLTGNREEKALWICSPGRRISNPLFDALFRNYRNQPGITTHISPHSLRRACATHMLQNGAHPLDVKELLGHASIRNLNQYLRLTIVDIKEMHSKSAPGQ